MAVTRFNPILWSSVLMTSLKKSLVFADLCNRDYEGEIKAAGDTVRITSISRPTINSYTRNADITYEELTDAQRTLAVDQEKYWAFGIDDVDAAQAKGNVVPAAMEEAAYGLADVVDQYVAGLYTQANSANAISTTSITTGDLAYTNIRLLMQKLDEANVPTMGRYVVMPPWYHSLLLENKRFTSLAESGSTEPIYNGVVGRMLGADIRVSNNCVNVTGDDYIVQAGVKQALTMAVQVTKTEALRSELRFADRVRGAIVYGAKMIRSEAVATLIASIT